MDRVQKLLGMGGEDPSEDVEKFNPNHDKNSGRFTTASNDTAVSAAALDSFFSDGNQMVDGFSIGNTVGLSSDMVKVNTSLVKALLGKTHVTKMDTVNFESLEHGVLAQCSFRWTKENPSNQDYHMILRIDTSQDNVAGEMWSKDQTTRAQGGLPWAAASLGKRSQMVQSLITHEIGHAIMGTYTVNHIDQSKWIVSENPLMGDTEWKGVVHEAVQEGWQPPSQYAKQDYAEMFAECYTKKVITGTTGSDRVDDYVTGVVANG